MRLTAFATIFTIAFGITSVFPRQAAGVPRFEDYPVTDIFRGTHAAPLLSSPQARRFRTRLREQVQFGPNFAGYFTLARWGCGAGCVVFAVIDARTGEVYFAPFTTEGAYLSKGERRFFCSHSSDAVISSELLIVQGEVNGKVGRHFFRWHDRQFLLVHFDECEWAAIGDAPLGAARS
jgi:hypothetical protein